MLQRDKKERNILHTVKGRKADWMGRILRGNCLLKHVSEGKDIEKNISEGKAKKKT